MSLIVSVCLSLCVGGMGVLCRPEDKGLQKPWKHVKLEIHKDGRTKEEECDCIANKCDSRQVQRIDVKRPKSQES